jgi:5,5'-dehydrodivanillate O-demethylase
MDDENTLSILWKSVRVPQEREPFVQGSIPTWYAPVVDEKGAWITSHVMNQDFLAWVGQGRIADRTKEKLVLSDGGIVMIRNRFFDDIEKVREGADPKGLIRDVERNKAVQLPLHDRPRMTTGYSIEEIKTNAFMRMTTGGFVLQAGQPVAVKRDFDKAMGLQP